MTAVFCSVCLAVASHTSHYECFGALCPSQGARAWGGAPNYPRGKGSFVVRRSADGPQLMCGQHHTLPRGWCSKSWKWSLVLAGSVNHAGLVGHGSADKGKHWEFEDEGEILAPPAVLSADVRRALPTPATFHRSRSPSHRERAEQSRVRLQAPRRRAPPRRAAPGRKGMRLRLQGERRRARPRCRKHAQLRHAAGGRARRLCRTHRSLTSTHATRTGRDRGTGG